MSLLDSLLPKLTAEGFEDDILEEEGVCKNRKTLDAIQYGKTQLLPGKKGNEVLKI